MSQEALVGFEHITSIPSFYGFKINKFNMIVTGIVIVYLIATNLQVSFGVVFGFFLISVAGLIWMVVVLLKDTSDLSSKTFDEHYYEDVD